MKNILEVKNITKIYQALNGEVPALNNVNFKVKPGEFVSIVGPSGCGKSTLLSIISGLENSTYGKIYIEDEEIQGVSRYIGLTRPKFARQTKHQVFFSFRNIALHFIINEMLAG